MAPVNPRVRLFLEADLAPAVRLRLGSRHAHYLGHVMRRSVGDRIAVFNGRDGEWAASVAEMDRKRCVIELEARLRPQSKEPDLWLAFAPVKKTRTDFLVEKATELGISHLLPVLTRQTSSRRLNVKRLREHAIEAAEQCERLTVPTVGEPVSLEKLVAEWPEQRPLLVPDETGGGRPIAEALSVYADAYADRTTGSLGGPCGILVGPEGGFRRSELDRLRDLPFVTAVGLGPRILRAETAALAALACWQALIGDWCEGPPREAQRAEKRPC